MSNVKKANGKMSKCQNDKMRNVKFQNGKMAKCQNVEMSK